MDATAPPGVPLSGGSNSSFALLLATAGFVAMYVPVYWWAAGGIWQSDDNRHGPLILTVIVWLFWTVRKGVAQAPYEPATLVGWPVFAAGLLIYSTGQAIDIAVFKFGSQLFVVAGALLLVKGLRALRVAWFAVLYLIFLLPLPATLVAAVTGPLKQTISEIVQNMLFDLGYPIAHTGVILIIGPYQLMVADACSGLNSMFSLSALGTLFMFLMARKSLLHNAIMLASILPIAFAANIIRVILLVLLTYHFGDEAGQGFLHGAAGVVLMIVALLIFFVLDAALALAFRPRAVAGATPGR